MRFRRNFALNGNPGRRDGDPRMPWSGLIPQSSNCLKREPHDPDMPRLRPSLFEHLPASVSVTDIATLAEKSTGSQ